MLQSKFDLLTHSDQWMTDVQTKSFSPSFPRLPSSLSVGASVMLHCTASGSASNFPFPTLSFLFFPPFVQFLANRFGGKNWSTLLKEGEKENSINFGPATSLSLSNGFKKRTEQLNPMTKRKGNKYWNICENTCGRSNELDTGIVEDLPNHPKHGRLNLGPMSSFYFLPISCKIPDSNSASLATRENLPGTLVGRNLSPGSKSFSQPSTLAGRLFFLPTRGCPGSKIFCLKYRNQILDGSALR